MVLSFIPSPSRSKLCAAIPLKRNCKINTITCRATQLRMERETNFYEVLALESKDVSVETIKRAYRSMALRYHPDVCPSSQREECTQMFIELQRAYKTLSDPALREKYNYRLGLVEGSFDPMRRKDRRSRFPREVWVDQLSELKVRSNKRSAKR